MKLATLCYVKRNGKTLMIHRIKKENDIHEGKWNGLGGKFQPGETPEECVIREVFEESGSRIHQPALRGILTFPKFARDEDWYAFVFVAHQVSSNCATCMYWTQLRGRNTSHAPTSAGSSSQARRDWPGLDKICCRRTEILHDLRGTR